MEGGEHGGSGRTVCVTGASGFIASWLVMRLLQLGYHVRATVRDPDNKSKVSYLLDLPKAGTHLTLWKADLLEEGSFDDAIQGCDGVFHVAAYVPVLPVNDPENELIKPTVNGVLNIMRSCSKAKTVKRLICTSTTGAVTVQPPPEPDQYDESFWTDVDFCKEKKIPGWPYFVAKTMAEKAAWKFAEENGIDLVAIHPSMVIGPFITPLKPVSIDITLALITRNEALYPLLSRGWAVHLDDVCSAHIYLLENPQAKGRYLCSSHCFTIFELSKSLSQKYPDCNIPTKFEGIDESLKSIPASSKKLLHLGFKFKYNPDEYNAGDLCSEAIEFCREKGWLTL
ncbi:dihydroflavonol 4-reductase-like [Camellia sinensis]|uniref:dihydroflavonol 4-reductase-like n=1 Tax=Camellia sinensis TaxID=4442 RepID=UPI0010358616|nr:dihydroflavonol 4-reductase-like [Camellia sinensis]